MTTERNEPTQPDDDILRPDMREIDSEETPQPDMRELDDEGSPQPDVPEEIRDHGTGLPDDASDAHR